MVVEERVACWLGGPHGDVGHLGVDYVNKVRRYIRKEGEKRKERIYIINLVAGLTSTRLSRSWQNSLEFHRPGRIWQRKQVVCVRCHRDNPVTISNKQWSPKATRPRVLGLPSRRVPATVKSKYSLPPQ